MRLPPCTSELLSDCSRPVMTVNSPHCVHVILDPDFDQRVTDLPTGEPVWIVASPTNEPAVRQLWQQRPPASHLDGITLFRSHGSPEDAFLREIGTIDLHHGEDSAYPPYSLLEVVGCQPLEEIRSALAEFGFQIIDNSLEGFSAQRSIPVT